MERKKESSSSPNVIYFKTQHMYFVEEENECCWFFEKTLCVDEHVHWPHLPLFISQSLFHFPFYFPYFPVTFLFYLPSSSRFLFWLNRKKVLQASKQLWCPWLSLCLYQYTGIKQIVRVAGLRGDLVRVSGLQDNLTANLLSLWLVDDQSDTPWLGVLVRLVL